MLLVHKLYSIPNLQSVHVCVSWGSGGVLVMDTEENRD